MALVHPLPDPVVDLIAARFRSIGEPIRIRLLERLHEGEATVQELQEATGTTQQNVSKHLRILLQGGIVGRRKAGPYAYYRITDETVFQLCEIVCESAERWLAEIGEALEATR